MFGNSTTRVALVVTVSMTAGACSSVPVMRRRAHPIQRGSRGCNPSFADARTYFDCISHVAIKAGARLHQSEHMARYLWWVSELRDAVVGHDIPLHVAANHLAEERMALLNISKWNARHEPSTAGYVVGAGLLVVGVGAAFVGRLETTAAIALGLLGGTRGGRSSDDAGSELDHVDDEVRGVARPQPEASPLVERCPGMRRGICGAEGGAV